ncbi:MAG: repair protein RecO [Acidobacteriota bacterium]|jgi:DNA repair protein RecO (recombination protein O)|nr:repair protein RecO [Acidobacteriota bacterium]
MGLVETEAVVLQTYKLADADKIVLCMTEKAGLVRGVARGARRLNSKFGASLEPFTLIRLTFFEKETRELVTIKGAEILKSYFDAAKDADSLEGLAYILELVKEFAPPHQPDERLFKMLRACIDFLAENPSRAPAVSTYAELWTLRLTGFLPEVRDCGVCGTRLNSSFQGQLYVSHEGVIWCQNCRGAGGQPLGREAHGLLSSTRSLSPGAWSQDYSGAGDESRRLISEIARRLVRRALEREPRAGNISKASQGVRAPANG